MRHKFPYKEFGPLEIPDKNISDVYKMPDISQSATEIEMIKSALNNPTDSKKLHKQVKPGMKITIAVDDNSRCTKTELMLPMVLAELEKAGVYREDVTVFIALGTHRKMTLKEMELKYTKETVATYRFVNPDWTDTSAYTKVGNRLHDFEFKIHKEVLQADFVIGVGQTIPHMIAGFGGGCKIINPGCADKYTIGNMHWLCTEVPEGKLFAVRDNKVREVIDDVALKVGLKFILNEVPGGDGQIAGAFAGHPVKAHHQACEFAGKVCQVPINAKADIVIADSYPADIDFWQALKGLNAAYGAVKNSGTVILVTPCPEGASSQHNELIKYGYLPLEKTKEMVVKKQINKAVGANLYLGRQLLDKADAILVTKGISEADTRSMGFQWAPDPPTALSKAIAKHGKSATINVLYKASKMITMPPKAEQISLLYWCA